MQSRLDLGRVDRFIDIELGVVGAHTRDDVAERHRRTGLIEVVVLIGCGFRSMSPPFHDLAHRSDLKSPTRSETISPAIPG